MREINNNSNNNVDMIKLNSVKKEPVEKQLPQGEKEKEEKLVQDFSNPKAEVLGRSQVAKMDNLKSDIDYLKKHPEVVKNSEDLFEIAIKQLMEKGDPQAYEKACAIATSEDAKALLASKKA